MLLTLFFYVCLPEYHFGVWVEKKMVVISGQFGDHFNVKHPISGTENRTRQVDMSTGDWGR